MKDVSSSGTNQQRRERRRHPGSPDKQQIFSERPERLKADPWSILFRVSPGPTANRLIIKSARNLG